MSVLQSSLGLSPAYQEAWIELGGFLGLEEEKDVQFLRDLMLEHSTQEHEPFLPPGYTAELFDGELLGSLRVLPSDWELAPWRDVEVVRDQVIDDIVDRHSMPPAAFPASRKGYWAKDGPLWIHFLLQSEEADCWLQPKSAWKQWMWTLGLEGQTAMVMQDFLLEKSSKIWRGLPPAHLDLSIALNLGTWREERNAQLLAACAREKLPLVARPDVFIPLGAPANDYDGRTWVTAFYRAGADRYFLPDLEP